MQQGTCHASRLLGNQAIGAVDADIPGIQVIQGTGPASVRPGMWTLLIPVCTPAIKRKQLQQGRGSKQQAVPARRRGGGAHVEDGCAEGGLAVRVGVPVGDGGPGAQGVRLPGVGPWPPQQAEALGLSALAAVRAAHRNVVEHVLVADALRGHAVHLQHARLHHELHTAPRVSLGACGPTLLETPGQGASTTSAKAAHAVDAVSSGWVNAASTSRPVTQEAQARTLAREEGAW